MGKLLGVVVLINQFNVIISDGREQENIEPKDYWEVGIN